MGMTRGKEIGARPDIENSLVKSTTQRSDTHLPRYRYKKPQVFLPLLIILPQVPVSLQFLNYR